jgi:glycosyltransferase involved in cell wall biosynthesis
VNKNVHFAIAGDGDMARQMIERGAEFGISEHVSFAGFARGAELSSLFRTADLFVMPSVSEPFGLTCVEAMSFGLPVIVSKQSGVNETVHHCFKVDFWDVEAMAAQILGILAYSALREELALQSPKEAYRRKWIDAARECAAVYCDVSPDEM